MSRGAKPRHPGWRSFIAENTQAKYLTFPNPTKIEDVPVNPGSDNQQPKTEGFELPQISLHIFGGVWYTI